MWEKWNEHNTKELIWRQTLIQTCGTTWHPLGCCMAGASATGWPAGSKGFCPGDLSRTELGLSWRRQGRNTEWDKSSDVLIILVKSTHSPPGTTMSGNVWLRLINLLCAALTVAPEAPGLWPPVPSSPAGSGSVAPPVGPLVSCCLSPCSSAGTHAGARAPPGNPDNTHPHWATGNTHPQLTHALWVLFNGWNKQDMTCYD